MSYSYQTVTVRELAEKAASGRLDLDPDWQRGSVWGNDRKSQLVDSLDNGYPIPPITTWTRPQGRSVMVDGRQRTEAIIGFINDEFCVDVNDWFSGRTEDAQQAFLDKQLQMLVFQSRVDEDDIVEYFERINSDSKQLSNGELINAQGGKPIVSAVTRMFFTPGEFREKWSTVFGEPQSDDKRKKYHENTVPYLVSSMYGVDLLTKSYPVLAKKLKQHVDVDAHMPEFSARIHMLLETFRRVFEECPHMRPEWTKHGLPPLRQVSAIWVSILEPQHIENPVEFWPRFYRTISDNADKKNVWKLHMRKNGKPAQLYKEIQYAIGCVA